MKRRTLLMVLVLCGCILAGCGLEISAGGNQDNQSGKTGSGYEKLEDTVDLNDFTETTLDTVIEAVADGEGDTLQVDLSAHGTVITGGTVVGSSKLILNGVVYEMPFVMSQLQVSGWSGEISDQTVFAGMEDLTFAVWSLETGEEDELLVYKVRNEAGEAQPVSACSVTKLEVKDIQALSETCSFVLPGGITKSSTAADVAAVYGGAVDNGEFKSVDVYEKCLEYRDQNNSRLTYEFWFHSDGTLDSVTISYVG